MSTTINISAKIPDNINADSITANTMNFPKDSETGSSDLSPQVQIDVNNASFKPRYTNPDLSSDTNTLKIDMVNDEVIASRINSESYEISKRTGVENQTYFKVNENGITFKPSPDTDSEQIVTSINKDGLNLMHQFTVDEKDVQKLLTIGSQKYILPGETTPGETFVEIDTSEAKFNIPINCDAAIKVPNGTLLVGYNPKFREDNDSGSQFIIGAAGENDDGSSSFVLFNNYHFNSKNNPDFNPQVYSDDPNWDPFYGKPKFQSVYMDQNNCLFNPINFQDQTGPDGRPVAPTPVLKVDMANNEVTASNINTNDLHVDAITATTMKFPKDSLLGSSELSINNEGSNGYSMNFTNNNDITGSSELSINNEGSNGYSMNFTNNNDITIIQPDSIFFRQKEDSHSSLLRNDALVLTENDQDQNYNLAVSSTSVKIINDTRTLTSLDKNSLEFYEDSFDANPQLQTSISKSGMTLNKVNTGQLKYSPLSIIQDAIKVPNGTLLVGYNPKFREDNDSGSQFIIGAAGENDDGSSSFVLFNNYHFNSKNNPDFNPQVYSDDPNWDPFYGKPKFQSVYMDQNNCLFNPINFQDQTGPDGRPVAPTPVLKVDMANNEVTASNINTNDLSVNNGISIPDFGPLPSQEKENTLYLYKGENGVPTFKFTNNGTPYYLPFVNQP